MRVIRYIKPIHATHTFFDDADQFRAANIAFAGALVQLTDSIDMEVDEICDYMGDCGYAPWSTDDEEITAAAVSDFTALVEEYRSRAAKYMKDLLAELAGETP